MIDATNMVVDAAVCRITQNILNKNLNGRSIFLTHSFECILYFIKDEETGKLNGKPDRHSEHKDAGDQVAYGRAEGLEKVDHYGKRGGQKGNIGKGKTREQKNEDFKKRKGGI